MGKRDLEKEKQLELAAVWGSEVSGNARFPKRKGSQSKRVADDNDEQEAPDVQSDAESELSLIQDGKDDKSGATRKKKTSKKRSAEYKLHCFVEPGTERNDVRMVFEAYEPKVEIRTAQKGNLLNKAQFAVLTFRNKAMALHAVKTLDGSNQRDLLGVHSLKLSLMLTRAQSKVARARSKRMMKRESKEAKERREAADDIAFIRNFVRAHTQRKL